MTFNLVRLLQDLDSDDIGTYLAAKDELVRQQQIALPALVRLMLNQSDRQGWRAAALVASMKDISTLSAFVQALYSPNSLIRQTAAQVLGELGNEAVIPHLLNRLYDESTLVRIWAVEAMGNLRSVRAVNPLIDLLAEADSYELQHSIIKAFGKIGDARAADSIVPFFESPDHHVCKRAHEVYKQLSGSTRGN